MTEEERRRIVEAGFEKFKRAADADKPVEDSPFDEMVAKLVLLDQDVREQLKPAIAAGARKDKRAFEMLVAQLYAHQLSKWAKLELEQLAAWMMTSVVMEAVYPREMGVDPKL